MRQFEINPGLKKKLEILSRKDKVLFLAVDKKIGEIISAGDLNHYKNLRYGLSTYKRIHLGSFVLVFQVRSETVFFEDFAHHDVIYKRS